MPEAALVVGLLGLVLVIVELLRGLLGVVCEASERELHDDDREGRGDWEWSTEAKHCEV